MRGVYSLVVLLFSVNNMEPKLLIELQSLVIAHLDMPAGVNRSIAVCNNSYDCSIAEHETTQRGDQSNYEHQNNQ